MKELVLSLAVLLGSVSAMAANPSAALAQDMSNGANNFYKSDKVDVRSVAFENQYNMKVAGHLFTPKDLQPNAKLAAIVVGHAMGAVKEQSADLYASKMAEQGTVNELNENADPVQREFYDFYRTSRGAYTPNGQQSKLTTKPTLSSAVKFMNFYPFNDIETISPRPMIFITGDKAPSREFSEDAYKRAGEPKELYIVPNAGHVDLYDRVNLIPFGKLTDFFRGNLSS
jgi:fermentation-respiration switch protein FrsA (DUF1100 family)